MPTPVGHSLIGLAVVRGYLGRQRSDSGSGKGFRRAWVVPLLIGLLVANLPDLDYIPGILTGQLNAFHHGYTHSIGWIMLAVTGVWMCWRALDDRVAWKAYAFLLLVGLSHLLADWVTQDYSLPHGVMALWPINDTYYLSDFHLFHAVRKDTWADIFQWHNAWVMLREFLITGLLFGGVVLLTRRRATDPASPRRRRKRLRLLPVGKIRQKEH